MYIFILHSKFQANAEELRERERLVEMQSEELVAAYQSCRKLQKKIAAVREELRMVLQHEFRFDIQPNGIIGNVQRIFRPWNFLIFHRGSRVYSYFLFGKLDFRSTYT